MKSEIRVMLKEARYACVQGRCRRLVKSPDGRTLMSQFNETKGKRGNDRRGGAGGREEFSNISLKGQRGTGAEIAQLGER